MRFLLIFGILTAICVPGLSPVSAADPPWIGTWKQNFNKSTVSSEQRFKRVTSRIDTWEDGLKVTYDMVGVRGGVTHMEWTGRFDGKDYPVQGVDYVLTNAYSAIDDHSYRIVIKVDGRIAATARVVVSADAKTLTTETTEKSSGGRAVVSKAVYEKQERR